MDRIESFKVDHTKLERGIYVSRIDGDVITYDIRMKKPNGGNYLKNAAMHTIEHIFATYVRNSRHSEQVIYFGPMGCRTGFYLVMRDSATKAEVLKLIADAFMYIAEYNDKIPGCSEKECGNYMEHDLKGAVSEAAEMIDVVVNWNVSKMEYTK